ncbi:MAG: aspartyl protease family protein [Luteolibacter sp.]
MNFILDSGAGASVLAKNTAAELGIAFTQQERVRTITGVENAYRAGIVHFQLGGPTNHLRFSANPLVIDFSSESRTFGSAIDGLIGADFFAGRMIRIDFKRSRLRVSPAGKPGIEAIRLPLSHGRDGMFVGLRAGGLSLPRVRLDTGCSRALCWSPPPGSQLRGSRHGRTLRTEVNFGPCIISDVATDVYRKPLFAGEDGLLGTELLSRFESIWIDSINHWIFFDSVQE